MGTNAAFNHSLLDGKLDKDKPPRIAVGLHWHRDVSIDLPKSRLKLVT
jgi:hypothetical protein